jgi:hypothetical protein
MELGIYLRARLSSVCGSTVSEEQENSEHAFFRKGLKHKLKHQRKHGSQKEQFGLPQKNTYLDQETPPPL